MELILHSPRNAFMAWTRITLPVLRLKEVALVADLARCVVSSELHSQWRCVLQIFFSPLLSCFINVLSVYLLSTLCKRAIITIIISNRLSVIFLHFFHASG